MRYALKFVLMTLVIVSHSAFACREFVGFTEHLKVSDARDYYVVDIQQFDSNGLRGRIVKSFNEDVSVGDIVSIGFIQGEQAYARCNTRFELGVVYLLRAESIDGRLETSRFSGYNISAAHERFSAYVQDIEMARDSR
ncbi:hypothetical protein CWE13_02925 [Aliidiomarina shirensis]|uniref:Uncharacterized protein n=1 Tax=Aliidiomarina shirensis TaxID=1048642 RepID=A0A432WXV6_9GAMM|nr:hypothetical protein [Aliidiomarina shirensis]RUO38614.1 hypothetical protein CWE13_02925 [Aliidiomarina shirensis]